MYEALVFVRYRPLFSVYELGRLLRMAPKIGEWGHLPMESAAGGAVAPGSLVTLDEVRT